MHPGNAIKIKTILPIFSELFILPHPDVQINSEIIDITSHQITNNTETDHNIDTYFSTTYSKLSVSQTLISQTTQKEIISQTD